MSTNVSGQCVVSLRLPSPGATSAFTVQFTHISAIIQPSNPLDLENRAALAIARGPFIYCAESIDNPEITDLRTVRVHDDAQLSEKMVSFPLEIPTSSTHSVGSSGYSLTKSYKAIGLQTDVDVLQLNTVPSSISVDSQYNFKRLPLTLIPYFLWANRGRSDLRVWLPRKGT